MSCFGKVAFETRNAAARILDRRSKRHKVTGRRASGGHLMPYRCATCGQWHLGTDDGRLG